MKKLGKRLIKKVLENNGHSIKLNHIEGHESWNLVRNEYGKPIEANSENLYV